MSTTSLFVELIVIGAGASAWLLFLTLSIFGFRWIPLAEVLSFPVLIVLLPLVYVLGIITDRIADKSFDRLWADRLVEEWFGTRGEYYNARRLILTKSEHLSELLEYGRSRLRICRGWAFNSLIAAVFLNLFIWTRLSSEVWAPTLSLFLTLAILALALACWYGWWSLSISEYRKIKEQSTLLTENEIVQQE